MSNTHEPITDEQVILMNHIAGFLDDIFNGENCPKGEKKWGFALLVFPFSEDIFGTGRVNYISNANREDMLIAMKEFIARAEGHYHEGTIDSRNRVNN